MTNYQIFIACAVPVLQAVALFFCGVACIRSRCWAYLLFGLIHLFGMIVSTKGTIEVFRSNPRPFHEKPMDAGGNDQGREKRYVTTPPKFPVGSVASAVGFWALARRETHIAARSKAACESPR